MNVFIETDEIELNDEHTSVKRKQTQLEVPY